VRDVELISASRWGFGRRPIQIILNFLGFEKALIYDIILLGDEFENASNFRHA